MRRFQMTEEQQRTLDVLPIMQAMTGQRQVICRPLRANVPIPLHPGWTLTRCPVCECDCWKTPKEPDVLPEGVTAACTSCALKAGMNRSHP